MDNPTSGKKCRLIGCVVQILPEQSNLSMFHILPVEHSETDETETMIITYGGNKYDPFTDGDELSSMIVKKLAKETAHNYDEKNRLVIKFV